MGEPQVKRIVELFHETDISTKKISDEIKKASQHAKNMTEHLTEEAIVILIWDLLPTSRRPSKLRIREVLRALTRLDEYTKKG